MDLVGSLQPFLLLAFVVAVLAMSSYYHGWWGRDGQRRRSALWGGFSATFGSLLFIVTGLLGVDVNTRNFLIRESAWTGSVIWPQVLVGLALIPIAAYLLRRGIRNIQRRVQQPR
jgi:hypothetical protein